MSHGHSNVSSGFLKTDTRTPPLPSGDYTVHVQSGKWGRSRNGHLHFAVTLAVSGGEHQDRRLFLNHYFHTEASQKRNRRQVEMLGFSGDAETWASQTPGIRCIASVSVRRSDGGGEWNEIDSIHPASAAASTPYVLCSPLAEITQAAAPATEEKGVTARECRHGFVAADKHTRRRMVDWWEAFQAAADCEDQELLRHRFLSAFLYPDEFLDHVKQTDSTKEYKGSLWSAFIHIDIDVRDNLPAALTSARAAVGHLMERYGLDPDELLAFVSGSKGFHIHVPVTLWLPEPHRQFNDVCRRMAERWAEDGRFPIDTGVYNKAQLLRMPNSRHPETGLCKRRIETEHLMAGTLESILDLAREPAPFEYTFPTKLNPQCQADWQKALAKAGEARRLQAPVDPGNAGINQLTWDFIINGCPERAADPLDKGRHLRLFSAAANLMEFGDIEHLIHALLKWPGERSGLAPSDVRRQIECGINHAKKGVTGG